MLQTQSETVFQFKKNGKSQSNAASNASLIHLHQITKVYKNAAGGYTALKGIDLEIGRGELVGIIGRSGSGKSTLIYDHRH